MQVTLLTIIFVLPGFISFLIIRTAKDGYGKNADIFDKTLYSLLFDVPIFLIAKVFVNSQFIVWLIRLVDKEYTYFNTINELYKHFADNIYNLFVLSACITVSAVVVGFGWIAIVNGYGWLYNNGWLFRNRNKKRKILTYHKIWKSCFADTEESMPIRVFKGNEEKPVLEGFLRETCTNLNGEIEMLVCKSDLFKMCMDIIC
jgi:hypothetical protein